MRLADPPIAPPADTGQALAMADAAMAYLCRAGVASLPMASLADLLRGLEGVRSRETAARTQVLASFAAQRGFEDDGARTVGSWLRWQTRITEGAAAGAI